MAQRFDGDDPDRGPGDRENDGPWREQAAATAGNHNMQHALAAVNGSVALA
jgi:hypothetical protein